MRGGVFVGRLGHGAARSGDGWRWDACRERLLQEADYSTLVLWNPNLICQQEQHAQVGDPNLQADRFSYLTGCQKDDFTYGPGQ